MGLTLREGDREYYYAALDRHFPGMKERYIKSYGNAYELPSPNAKKLTEIFKKTCKENVKGLFLYQINTKIYRMSQTGPNMTLGDI